MKPDNLHQATRAPLSAAKQALLDKYLQGRLTINNDKESILRRSSDEDIPLSFSQQRLYFIDRLNLQSAAYNLPAALILQGELDCPAVEHAINEIVKRHEILRTTFVIANGKPVQRIAPTLNLVVTMSDLSSLPEGRRKNELHQVIEAQAQRPFNLEHGPLLRAELVRLADDQHVFLFTVHHIIFDGWSASVLVNEFAALYKACSEGLSISLPELPIQYADYSLWQRGWLQGAILQQQLDYWKQQLKGAPPVLELPTDRPRQARQNHYGSTFQFSVQPVVSEQLKTLAQCEGVTLFMVLFAAFNCLLSRYSGQQDICVGTPIANRMRMELEGLIGFFVNTLVLRVDLSGNPTFIELLRKVRDVCLGAQEHQDLPFEKLVEELQPVRNTSYSPFFQAMFSMNTTPSSQLQIPGLTLTPLKVERGATAFDLVVDVSESEQGLQGTMEYSSELFDSTRIESMAGHFQNILESIVADPGAYLSEISLYSQNERRQLLLDCTAPETPYPKNSCLHGLFEAQAARTPTATALIWDDEELSYSALNIKANRLAHYLKARGVGPESKVVVCVNRSSLMIVGILGILKAGGAYVPVDPEYPEERIKYVLNNSGARVLLTQAHLRDNLPDFSNGLVCLDQDWAQIAAYPETNADALIDPANTAYVIYTSGSTGRPNGVEVSHRNAVHSTSARFGYYPTTVERFLLLSSVAFDSSVAGIFWTLGQGGTLVLPLAGTHKDPKAIVKLIAYKKITHLLCLPSFYGLLLGQESPLEALSTVIVAGESCARDIAVRHYRQHPNANLYNEYGPTEATVWSSVHNISATGCQENYAIPIGRPIANTRLYLLDAYWNPVPIGSTGELYIGGAGVTRGYLNRPELTAERFLPDPFGVAGERIYKTGDAARRLADGGLEFLGRIDHQVKIRGFRVEMEEIETHLLEHPEIKEAVVVLREDALGDSRLVAYIVPHIEHAPMLEGRPHHMPACAEISATDGIITRPEQTAYTAQLTSGSLRRFIKERLPEYMVPSSFVILESLPLTPNGKIDRKSLPVPDANSSLPKQIDAPSNATEEVLMRVWKEVLLVENVGIHDNFFDLGGHSLSAVQVMARVEDLLGIDVSVALLFDAPTIAELALKIIQQQMAAQDVETMAALLTALEQLPDNEVQHLLRSASSKEFI